VVSKESLADPNETRRIRPGMPILLNQNRLLAFIALRSAVWLNAAVGVPVEAHQRTLSARKGRSAKDKQ